MTIPERLPEEFLRQVYDLEDAYLNSDDPIRQSGFGGGAKRWNAERSPILQAVDNDGTLLDVGCANGYLLESLVSWAQQESGIRLTPYGVDINAGLIVEAMRRWPAVPHHFWVANAWDFQPPLKFDFVYSLADCVPAQFLAAFVARLLDRTVKPGGRLIMGSYGSASRRELPVDLAELLDGYGFRVAGSMHGGRIPRSKAPVARFAWIAN